MSKIYNEDGEIVKCSNCKKELNTSMELEYSQEINSLCCCPDCATNIYYDYMMSKPVDEDDLIGLGYKIKRRKITMAKNLLEITGQESGLILSWDGELIICNWQSINGLPRLDPMRFGVIGLGEELHTVGKPEQIDDIGEWLENIDYDLIYDRYDDFPTLYGQSGRLFTLRDYDICVIAPDNWN